MHKLFGFLIFLLTISLNAYEDPNKFKDIDPKVKAQAVTDRTNFYKACGQGIFCNLGQGDVDFAAVRALLMESGFSGWCTVEQDCDPTLDPNPLADAVSNRSYLKKIGF